MSAAPTVRPIPDVRESDLRAVLIRLAVSRKPVAIHFRSRDGVECVAVGRVCSVDGHGVRVLHARDGDLYTVVFAGITRVEGIEERQPPPRPREEGGR